MDNKPSISEILKSDGLFAKKSLGQHFLLDLNLTAKIARLGNIGATDIIFEIGPGPGGLTHALLQSAANKIVVIEKDARFAAHLRDYFSEYDDKLIVIEGDALKSDLVALCKEHGTSLSTPKIIANLPYNVGTQLLINWISAGLHNWPMVLMFQKEVALRICAKVGDNNYGRLAILVDAKSNSRIAMPISKTAFIPPPKVESAVVCIDAKAQTFDDLENLGKVTAAAFGQRRKMLRTSLAALGNPLALLEAAQIDPTLRAEAVPPDGFFRLASALKAMNTK